MIFFFKILKVTKNHKFHLRLPSPRHLLQGHCSIRADAGQSHLLVPGEQLPAGVELVGVAVQGEGVGHQSHVSRLGEAVENIFIFIRDIRILIFWRVTVDVLIHCIPWCTDNNIFIQNTFSLLITLDFYN